MKSLFQGYQMSVIESDGISYARLNPPSIVYAIINYKDKYQLWSKRLGEGEKREAAIKELGGDATYLGQVTLPEFINTQAYLYGVKIDKAADKVGWMTKKEIENTDNPILVILAHRAGIL